MSQQNDRYIPGVPCWVDLATADDAAAIAFYSGLFGWECQDAMPPGSPVRYSMARLRGGDVAAIASVPPGAPAPAPAWRTYVWVEDADATAAKVRDAGGRVLAEPSEVGAFGRMAEFADTEGAEFRVWQPAEHRGATVVNEHGSVNFNNLAARDPDAAAAFYGAVFGWDLLRVGDGAMWALPAYGDFLEQRTPGMRENMAEMGAPPRFEEVVAGTMPLEGGAAPHWGVTFAVDDADAIAERAVELGGQVVVPPFDAPWVRMAIIADPQGATFWASKFVPENRDVAGAAGATTGA